MGNTPTPTIRQLAALAGVSRTTVSLALRNHPSLPADTRARIQKLAATHGYRQDPVVSTLMAQLRKTRATRGGECIAYFTTWDTANGWRASDNENNFFVGACERAEKLGYEIEHIWAREPGMTTARLSKILYTRSIRGIVLAPFANPRSHLTMDWKHFATAAISHTLVRPLVNRASHAHYNGMFLALRHLRHHGYRRIGFATRLEQSERVANAWLAALLVYQQTIPAENRIRPLLSPVTVHQVMDKAAFHAWVRAEKPDVVVSNLSDVLEILVESGLRVPEDIGFASIDLTNPRQPWSGIDQQAKEVGAATVDLVVTQLQNNEFGLPKHPKTMNIDGIWREGNTLLPHRIAAAR